MNVKGQGGDTDNYHSKSLMWFTRVNNYFNMSFKMYCCKDATWDQIHCPKGQFCILTIREEQVSKWMEADVGEYFQMQIISPHRPISVLAPVQLQKY